MAPTSVIRAVPLLLAALASVTMVGAQDTVEASAQAVEEVPHWATENPAHLSLSVGGRELSQEFTVIPLTRNLGANQSDATSQPINIQGNIISAEPASYGNISGSQDIAYLSCDDSNSNVNHNTMLNDLMGNNLRAIVLYSTSRNWCELDSTRGLRYTTIFSMADAPESVQVLNHLNQTDNGQVVRANITSDGNDNSDGIFTDNGRPGSSTAMNILYAVTGVVALMFVIIIISGAIRAHRNPERYGPRGAASGRPRQSRAKGLARAVLETLPIVKFGDQQPEKADPDAETATTDGQDTAAGRRGSEFTQDGAEGSRRASAAGEKSRRGSRADGGDDAEAEHLGCSICTEDFNMGEDVRVLPCKHQFHPTCIDPWLVNVSGTCPLCRMDLRPGRGDGTPQEGGEGSALPPPLVIDGEDGDHASNHQRNRVSRIFDVNRLRQATAEEQMAALRQMRGAAQPEQPEAAAEEADAERTRQSARFAAKLKDRFRIRTRAQSRQRRRSRA